jgi:hypothetical protein
MPINLMTHQLKALHEIHDGAILKGGVGSGKSIVSLVYFYTKVCDGQLKINGKGDMLGMQKPRPLYIITTAKKRDNLEWEEECSRFGLSRIASSSISGVKVTVDSWNSITKYTEVKDAFFIFDEQRLVGSGAWVKAFLKIAKANRWIMLSATPGDSWMDYAPVFIANGFYKNKTEFLRRHVVYNNFSTFPKVDHYVETDRLERLRREVLVEMPYVRHTVRHVLNTIVSYDEDLMEKIRVKRWHIYEDRPLKNVGELFLVARKLVNSDVSRMGAIMALIEKHPRLIVFYNFDYELEILRTLQRILPIPFAEWNGHKHEDIPDTERWVYLVQYTAGAEGWNCVSTNAMAFWSLNYSYKLNEQARGRIDRLNTLYTDLYYYVLRSSSWIDREIVKSLAGKRDFNERSWAKANGFEDLLAA